MPPTSTARALAAALALLAVVLPAEAQSAALAPPRLNYWLTAGAGVSAFTSRDSWTGINGSALAAAGSVQYRALVGSVRWARASDSPSSDWDIGVLAGVGSPTRFPVHGTIAAGIGRSEDWRGRSGATMPVSLEVGWRLTPVLGVGVYAFSNFGGPAEFLGATIAIQLGRLR